MDAYSYVCNPIPSSSSSSNCSYSFDSQNDNHQFSSAHQHRQEMFKREKPPPPFQSSLHSVRKFPGKNIITKKPIAPLPPTPPKIYKVAANDFRDTVQKLTSAAEFQPTRLQEVAPPPLNLSPPDAVKNPALLPASSKEYPGEEKEESHKSFESTFGALSPLGFTLSPSSIAWCSYNLLSPGTLASFEPSVVL